MELAEGQLTLLIFMGMGVFILLIFNSFKKRRNGTDADDTEHWMHDDFDDDFGDDFDAD